MRWPSIAAAVMGLGVGLALVVPIVAFALFTRATIESDILARWEVDRELTARLAAAIVQRRLQSDVVSLGLFAGRPDVLEAIRGRDGRALDGLLAGFTSPNAFKLVGVVDPHGAALAHEPEGLVDPSFAADVAANAASVSQSQQGWTFMLPDGRAPTGAFGTVAVIVVPVDVGAERWAMYGLLDFNNFTSVFDPVPFQSYRSIVVLDEKGRLVVAYGTGLAITANSREYLLDRYSVEIPGLQQAMSSELGTLSATIEGQEWLAVHVAVIPRHWVLYLLEAPAPALAGARRLTEQVTVAAGIAGALATVLAFVLALLIDRLRRQRREIALANEHKSQFLANMSHELRTPLNSIIGFSEVLLERMFGELNEKQEDYVSDILSSGNHQLALINDILDLSKVDAGKIELHPTEFDVTDAVTSVHRSIVPLARAKRQQMLLVLDDALGTARLDEARFRQVLLNLLSNAVKYTPEGGSITMHGRLHDGHIEVEVTDSGVGIAPEDQEKVFEEFERVGGSYAHSQQGTGLGLALARRFVRLMGGEIGLTSVPGRGSTFTVRLPDGVGTART